MNVLNGLKISKVEHKYFYSFYFFSFRPLRQGDVFPAFICSSDASYRGAIFYFLLRLFFCFVRRAHIPRPEIGTNVFKIGLPDNYPAFLSALLATRWRCRYPNDPHLSRLLLQSFQSRMLQRREIQARHHKLDSLPAAIPGLPAAILAPESSHTSPSATPTLA